jgi:hypothetical protein
MSIINRRNAVFGWIIWTLTKAVGKQKARQAVPGPGDHVGLNKGAIATIAAGVAAALFFWRKKSSDSPAG